MNTNFLGIDFEDWYHPQLIQKHLDNEILEPMMFKGLEKILEMLRKTNTYATFFVVGKVLELNPEILKKNPKISCVVGLTTEPSRLLDLRKNRMNSLRETEPIDYTNLEMISKEVEGAKQTFKKYNWPIIDVTRKSVEETAASIIKIHEIYKNNEK